MKLKSNWILLLALSFFISCKSTKDVASKAAEQKVENYDLEKALLWEITGKDLKEPSYLFGTIHMIDKESFFWPEGTLAAFEDAENVAFEIDMDDMSDMGAQMGLLTKAFMKDNQKLSDFYNEADWGIVEGHFKDLGIPMFFLEKLKPMFLTVFASGDVDISQGFGGADASIKSYEMELYSLCESANKDVDGLETIEYQLSVFDSIPYQAQADMLLETIKNGDESDDSFKELVEMYVNQDINKMVATMSEEEGVGEYEDIVT